MSEEHVDKLEVVFFHIMNNMQAKKGQKPFAQPQTHHMGSAKTANAKHLDTVK